MGLIAELKRRNVFRVGVAYVLLAWVVIQVTDIVGPAINLPEWTLTVVTWFGVIGFPFALFFAWAFELTPDGIRRERDVDRAASVTHSTGRKIDFVIIGLLVVALLFVVMFDDVPETPTVAPQGDPEEVAAIPAGDRSYDSIGVLPFENMSSDPEQEYLSDGIAEELLNALAKLQNLQVAARTSSFAFKGQKQSVTEIGSRLKVDTILEGSVRKSGNKLRITAQLIDTADGYHLWSETYDRELTDVFQIQDDITQAIVAALRVHLDTGEAPVVEASGATSMEAYDAYLRGRHQLRQSGEKAFRAALASFREATEIDPEFAPAWAGRALTVMYLRQTDFYGDIPREEARLLARNNIDRAMALDSELAEVYVAEGMLLADDYKYDEALQSFDKAVTINPSLAEGWTWRARILGRFGRIREARENMLKALRLDPLDAGTAFFGANLAIDFYDPEFFETVKNSSSQFPQIRLMLEGMRVAVIEPLTPESYEQGNIIAESMGIPAELWRARIDVSSLKVFDEEALARQSRYPGEFLMWVYMGTDQWEKALEMYEALPPERQQADINLEELSEMQASMGQCGEALESLRKAQDGEVRIHGMVDLNMGRSNVNLALNRAYCLRQLGQPDEAEEILSQVRRFINTLRDNAEYGYALPETKLLILQGDIDSALGVLEVAVRRGELDWTSRYDPIVRTLGEEPRFVALYEDLDREIDALRAEFGMPPADI
jgi:TolB-like protein/Tfp pilus assembly protein PilF